MNKAKNIIAAVLSGAIAFAYLFYFINTIMGFVDLASVEGGGGFITSTIVLSVITLLVAVVAVIILLAALFKLVGRSHFGNPIALFILGLAFVSLEKVINSVGTLIIIQSYAPGVNVDGTSIVAMAFFVISLILFIVSASLSKNRAKGAVGVVGSIASIFFLIPLFMSLSSRVPALSMVYIIVLLISYLGVFGYFVFDAVSDFMANQAVSTKEEPVTEARVESTYNKVNSEQGLLRLKRLLDQGVITQEEYNEKRKQYVDSL